MAIDQQRLQNDQSYRDQVRDQGYFVGSEGGQVYAQNVGTPEAAHNLSSGGGGNGGGGGNQQSGGGGGQQGANLNAAQLLLNQAQQAAYQAYLTARLNLDTDELAFRKATQAFQDKLSEANVTGTYNGQPTMAAQAQMGFDASGKPTLAREQFQANTATDYLKLIAGLRGPQDYGQYLRVIGSTPGGLRDLVAGASGQYVPGTGASTGVQPQPASLGGLIGATTPATNAGALTDYTTATQGLPAPNQISPAAWNAYTDTQKKILLGMYESSGYNPQDVVDLYKQSLPKYGAAAGTGTIKL